MSVSGLLSVQERTFPTIALIHCMSIYFIVLQGVTLHLHSMDEARSQHGNYGTALMI